MDRLTSEEKKNIHDKSLRAAGKRATQAGIVGGAVYPLLFGLHPLSPLATGVGAATVGSIAGAIKYEDEREKLTEQTRQQKRRGESRQYRQRYQIESDIDQRTGNQTSFPSLYAREKREHILKNANKAAKHALEKNVYGRFSKTIGMPEKAIDASSDKIKKFLSDKEVRDLRLVNRYTAGLTKDDKHTSRQNTRRAKRVYEAHIV